MKFSDYLLTQLDAFAANSALPKVRALHLPPPPADGTARGEFFALELDDGSIGLSYALLDRTLEQLSAGRLQADVCGADALALAHRYALGAGIDKTVGFAAANALTRCLYDRAGYVVPASADSIGEMSPVPTDHIGMIGLFRPLIQRIVASGARLTVIELDERLAGAQDGYVVTLDRRQLADCNKVISTSTLLLNDTLDDMLGACHAARWFALLGPSAGCLPDALFARGVTRVGGTWVLDGAGFIEALKSGAPTSPFSRKCVVTAATYPGAANLLARSAGRG